MARGAKRRQERTTSPLIVPLVLALVSVVGWQAWGASSHDDPAVTSLRDEFHAFLTTDAVNLRSGPGTSFVVLDVVPEASAVDVTGEGENGFMPVRVGGRDAWIAADYLIAEGSVRASTYAAPDVVAAPTEMPAVAIAESPASDGVETVEPDPEPRTLAADVPVDAETVVEPAGAADEEIAQPFLAGERWVEVDRTSSTVTLHEGETVVAEFSGLIGKDPAADGYYSTATGTFYVYSMNRALTETPFAPGVYLTEWVGFDPERSNGFHSPVRDAAGNVVQTGGTATLGCVRLGEADARQMFDFAFIGMRVEIHD